MSKESMSWLRSMIFTVWDAWHGPASHPNGISVTDAGNLLDKVRVEAIGVSGITSAGHVIQPTDNVLLVNTSDYAESMTDAVYGWVGADSYTIHQFRETLLQPLTEIAGGGDSVVIGSVGLLKNGAQAWVQILPQDNEFTSPAGDRYRYGLLATTSHNGTLSTVVKQVRTRVECDNTLSSALSERAPTFSARHTKNSLPRITAESITAKLGTLAEYRAKMDTEIANLLSDTVSDERFGRWLDTFVPVKADDTDRKVTFAETKRDTLRKLWKDLPEGANNAQGTAYGIAQIADTYERFNAIIRGFGDSDPTDFRAMRVWESTVTGSADDASADALRVLATV